VTRPARPDQGHRPTVKDVAALAGVSKGAVSMAFNGRPGVSEATRARVLAAAGALAVSRGAAERPRPRGYLVAPRVKPL
jgi:transcriptional regulator with XRE-family HTH domain